MKSMTELVVAWGRKELAGDLGVPVERVRAWERFNTIPDKHWRELLDKAPKRNIKISPELLIDLAARN